MDTRGGAIPASHKGRTAKATAVLSTRSLSRDYGPIRVVADVSLDFHAGSIHALLGENGAGKSTLIKMVAGALQSSDGTIEVDGAPMHFRSVKEAQAAGIVALPQELMLVPTLGAAENIFLGVRRPGVPGLVDRRRLAADARDQLARLGQDLNVTTPWLSSRRCSRRWSPSQGLWPATPESWCWTSRRLR